MKIGIFKTEILVLCGVLFFFVFAYTATGVNVQSHKLSEIRIIDTDFDMMGYNIINISYIGIGTANPQDKLEVRGNIRVDGNLILESDPFIISDGSAASGRMFSMIYALFTNEIAYKKPYSAEYYNYSTGTWTNWTGVDFAPITDMLNDAIPIDYDHRTFRFTYYKGSSNSLGYLVVIGNYFNSNSQARNTVAHIIVEFDTDPSFPTPTIGYDGDVTIDYAGLSIIRLASSGYGKTYVRITMNVSMDAQGAQFYLRRLQLTQDRYDVDWISTILPFSWNKDGDVGIGASNPDAKLDIYGASASTTNLILSANYENAWRWRFKTIDRGNGIDLDITVSDNIDVEETLLQLSRSGSGRPELNFKNGWFTINNGNVGIGTTSPIQKLDVVGNINATGYLYGKLSDETINEILRMIPQRDSSGNIVYNSTPDINDTTSSGSTSLLGTWVDLYSLIWKKDKNVAWIKVIYENRGNADVNGFLGGSTRVKFSDGVNVIYSPSSPLSTSWTERSVQVRVRSLMAGNITVTVQGYLVQGDLLEARYMKIMRSLTEAD